MTLKGCIVRPQDNWILQRIAESWSIPGARVCDKPDADADYSIYVNYALWETVGVDYHDQAKIGWFTHKEPGPLGNLFDRVAKQMDHCISMSDKTARMLPPEKTTVIHTAPHPQFRKGNIVLGVCGRYYARKNVSWISELQKIPGIEIRYTGGKLQFDQLPDWYRSIDYLVVLSGLEGGPLPVIEALAMGKPVIAPDVGWCWDYPTLRYSGFDELMSIVERLIVPNVSHESAEIMKVINGVCVA